MKRILPVIIYVSVLLTYFLSEALLRRVMYYVPADKTAGKDALINHLPDFLQNYFKNLQKIADLEDRLDKAKDQELRVQLLYELANEVSSKSRRTSLMKQIVKEAPDSPKAAMAWSVVLQDMSEDEILSKYLDYIYRCDIRTQDDKIKVWQVGLTAMRNHGKKARMEYVKKMAENRVCARSFDVAYEELWVSASAKGNMKTAKLAEELHNICRNMVDPALQKR